MLQFFSAIDQDLIIKCQIDFVNYRKSYSKSNASCKKKKLCIVNQIFDELQIVPLFFSNYLMENVIQFAFIISSSTFIVKS